MLEKSVICNFVSAACFTDMRTRHDMSKEVELMYFFVQTSSKFELK